MNALATSARQRLGETIRFHREQRRFSLRELANCCGTSVADVEDWESGRAVPTGTQWARLKGASRGITQFTELHQRALVEQESARPATNGAKMQITTAPITTSLGPKLVAAIEAPPKPAAPKSTQPRVRRQPLPPPGAMLPANVAARREYALNIIRQRPKIQTRGADSLQELMLERFGVGTTPDVIEELREQVKRERGAPASAPPPAPPPVVATAVMPGAHGSPKAVNERDLAAAVELVLGAVPNLRAFTITVDDTGEASVDYKVREVVVRETGGTMKVRAKP